MLKNKQKIIYKLIIITILIVGISTVLHIKKSQKNNLLNKETEKASKPEKESIKKIKKELPKLIDLGAHKCKACKAMTPILAQLKKEYKNQLEVVFIDVWKDSKKGAKYNIKLIPTQIFFDPKGKELFRHIGFFSKQDILKKWKELGFVFNKKK